MKSSRIKFQCQICQRKTVHEIREIDGQEAKICLRCEAEGISLAEGNNASYGKAMKMVEFERNRVLGSIPKFHY